MEFRIAFLRSVLRLRDLQSNPVGVPGLSNEKEAFDQSGSEREKQQNSELSFFIHIGTWIPGRNTIRAMAVCGLLAPVSRGEDQGEGFLVHAPTYPTGAAIPKSF